MALLFNAPKEIWIPRPFICISRNKTTQMSRLAKIRYALSPVDVCKWATYILTCSVVKNPQMFAITDTHIYSQSVQVYQTF